MSTTYVVLRQATEVDAGGGDFPEAQQVPIPDTFIVITNEDGETRTFTAANDIHAIRVAAKETGIVMDGAVAVPLRSWKLRKPERRVEETTLWQ